MADRAPTARVLARARIQGRRIRFDKPGRDGSGKANLREQAGGSVWGVVYSLAAEDWPALDRSEGGYARVPVEVHTEAGETLAVETYVALRTTADAVAFDWYKRLIVEGARSQALPDAWVDELRALPARPADERLS